MSAFHFSTLLSGCIPQFPPGAPEKLSLELMKFLHRVCASVSPSPSPSCTALSHTHTTGKASPLAGQIESDLHEAQPPSSSSSSSSAAASASSSGVGQCSPWASDVPGWNMCLLTYTKTNCTERLLESLPAQTSPFLPLPVGQVLLGPCSAGKGIGNPWSSVGQLPVSSLLHQAGRVTRDQGRVQM